MSTMTRVALRSVAGLAVAALSGLLLTLAFPPYDLWPLIWIGFVPAVVAQHRIVPRRLSGVAYGLGMGAFFWGYFGPMFAGSVWFMEWLPLEVAVVAALLSGGDRAFHERTGYRWFVLDGAVVWVGIEAIRGFAPVVGTGGFMAYALYSQPWLIQPVGIFSIYGLSLLVMVANYAIALGIIALIDRPARLDPSARPVSTRLAGSLLAGVGIALVAWTGLSLALLGQAAQPGADVKVAAVQPGASATQAEHTKKLFDQTRQAAAQGARLVVWPEGALNFDPRVGQAGSLRALTGETGVYLAVGYGVRTNGGLRNEAVVITPGGDFLGPYGKDHPVVWLGESSVSRGTYPTYETPLGRLGTIICYDLNFTDTARKTAANGAQLIAAGSNDWPSLATKQYTNLVMRAVENRVSLVKADSRYDSAIIDPAGRIVRSAVSTSGMQTTLVAGVPMGAANAPLIRLGDWVGWLCIVGILVFAVMGPITARRARGSRAAPLVAGEAEKVVAGR